MEYAMLIYGDEEPWRNASAAEIEAATNAINAWAERWKDRIADNGAELAPAQASKTISAGEDGNMVVTDGPYLQLTDVFGGWVVLVADSLDDAVEVAAEWPTIASHGNTVEVRPVTER